MYTNSSSSGLRAPLRPEKKIKTLYDILEGSLSLSEGGARGTWIKGGEKLVTVVMQLRAGLLGSLGSAPGTVAVLVEDPTGSPGIYAVDDTRAKPSYRCPPDHSRARAHAAQAARRRAGQQPPCDDARHGHHPVLDPFPSGQETLCDPGRQMDLARRRRRDIGRGRGAARCRQGAARRRPGRTGGSAERRGAHHHFGGYPPVYHASCMCDVLALARPWTERDARRT